MSERTLTYDEWVVEFKPRKNPLTSDPDCIMFETFGEEAAFVKGQNELKIWTLVDCDGETSIVDGWHFINRLGYFITEVPRDIDTWYNIVDD